MVVTKSTLIDCRNTTALFCSVKNATMISTTAKVQMIMPPWTYAICRLHEHKFVKFARGVYLRRVLKVGHPSPVSELDSETEIAKSN